MSFARFGPDSDVYVYLGLRGYVCERCPRPGDAFVCATAPEMLKHLGEHRARGERVPEAAFSELRKEEARDLGQELDILRLHHTQELVPSKELAEVVGEKPMTRSEMVAKLWAYIRRHELQDAQQKRFVQADEKLR